MSEVLVAMPTYNEKDTVSIIIGKVLKELPYSDILIIDDNSPDKTADIVEKEELFDKKVFLLKRPSKLGIGSAHLDGIEWAYERSYKYLITLDADLTHNPSALPKLLKLAEKADLVVGSRFLLPEGMYKWRSWRKALSLLGHFATGFFLKLHYDSTNSLRVYNLKIIPRSIFSLINSSGYAFFFESLYIFQKNGLLVLELPVTLANRVIGNSKMSFQQIALSILTLVNLYIKERVIPEYFKIKKFLPENTSRKQVKINEWDTYWESKGNLVRTVYEIFATMYRNIFIKRMLSSVMFRFVKRDSSALHAGCGSGQVDQGIRYWLDIIAIDISYPAVMMYQQLNYPYANASVDNILNLSFKDSNFDVVYNLGVMEHLNDSEINTAMNEFNRVLKDRGLLVIFWPHFYSPMRLILRLFSWVLMTAKDDLLPPEINRIKSKSQIERIALESGFKLNYYKLGLSDLFTQSIVVLQKV